MKHLLVTPAQLTLLIELMGERIACLPDECDDDFIALSDSLEFVSRETDDDVIHDLSA